MARHIRISAVGHPSPPDFGDSEATASRVVDYLRNQIKQVTPQQPDLIVLPERSDIPDDVAHSQDRDRRLPDYLAATREPIAQMLSEIADEHHCHIAHSTYLQQGDQLHNSTQLIGRDGQRIGQYSKHRPMIEEIEEGITPGQGAVVLDCDFGRIGFAICFDLNFDELRKEYKALKPDIIAFSSVYHGGLMQAYWAYDCRTHFIGAISPEAVPSEVYSPVGQRVASSSNYMNHLTTTVNLDCAVIHLDCLFPKLDAIRKQYGTKLRIQDPGQLGSVLISAESQDLSIKEVINTYELELLDAYLERARNTCNNHPALSRQTK